MIFGRFAKLYNHLLNRYTYPVQMVSAGTLWCSGDLLCQCLVSYHKSKEKDRGNDVISIQSSSSESSFGSMNKTVSQTEENFAGGFRVDWPRALRMTLYGTLFSAPIYTFWFSVLEKASIRIFKGYSQIPASTLTPSTPLGINVFGKTFSVKAATAATSRMWKITIFKTVLDVIIFDPFYLSFFFCVTGKMENKSLSDIKRKLEDELTTTFLADVAVWLPIQLANFRYVSVIYQPLVVQCINLFWNTFLSWVQHKDAKIDLSSVAT